MTRGQYGNVVGQAPWRYPYSYPSSPAPYPTYPIPSYQIPTYQYPAYQYPASAAPFYSAYQDPGYAYSAYQYPAPQYSAPQYQYSASQYQYSAPQYQYSAPQYQYSAPQYQYSAPQYQYPTPQYSAPQSAPQYQYAQVTPMTAAPVAATATRPATSPAQASAPAPASASAPAPAQARPAPAPVVPLGQGHCGVKEYGNVTAEVRDAILAKLREEKMTVTGSNPWSVDTNKAGVKLRAAWDPQSQKLRVIVSDWGPLAKSVGCDLVWSEINPVLTKIIESASAAVSGWDYGYAQPYGYSYYGYPSVGWF